MDQQPYVFISYSSKESYEANAVRDVLLENGLACWMAPQSIEGGSDYTKSIPEAISNCTAMVLVCSQNAQDSYWVKSEVIEAISQQKPIVPFIIDDFQLNKEFNFMLSPAHRILAYQNKARAYETLVSSLKRLMPITAAQPQQQQRPQPQQQPRPQQTWRQPQPQPGTQQTWQQPQPQPRPQQTWQQPQPAPAPVQPVAVAVKPKVKSTPSVICWIAYGISFVIFLIMMSLLDGHAEIATSILMIFPPFMLAATLIILFFCRKHKSAPLKEINACRMKIAVLFAVFTSVMILLCFLRIFILPVSLGDMIGILMMLCAVIEIITCVVSLVKFKRTQYVIR